MLGTVASKGLAANPQNISGNPRSNLIYLARVVALSKKTKPKFAGTKGSDTRNPSLA